MDKHTEIIFNLFIMEYFNYLIDDEKEYNMFVDTYFFKIEKSCFPENEIACQTLVSGNYGIDFPCNIIHEKNTTVKARKVAKYNKKTKNWEL